VVREALMEPLRKCRTAKFFRPVHPGYGGGGVAAGAGAAPPGLMYTPEMADPPCSRCPINLSAKPVAPRTICACCGCMRATLFDLRSEELKVPDIAMVRLHCRSAGCPWRACGHLSVCALRRGSLCLLPPP